MGESQESNADQLLLSDGRSLTYRRWGLLGGRPLVWIGGNPGSRLSRHPDPAFYERHGLDAVTFDRPGYGRSTRLPGRSVADTASDVRELIDALGWSRCEIVGLSGGGAHALACGALIAERVSVVAVVGSPSPPAETPGWEANLLVENRRSRELVRHDRDGLDGHLRVSAERIVDEPLAVIAGMMEEAPEPDVAFLQRPDMAAMLTESLSEAFAVSHHGWFDDTVAINTDWGFNLGTVGVPVLIFHGALDRNAPVSQARALSEVLPRAYLTIWPDLGHISSLRRIDEVVAELYEMKP